MVTSSAPPVVSLIPMSQAREMLKQPYLAKGKLDLVHFKVKWMVPVRIIENDKIDAYFRGQVRSSEG